jgi:acyl-coenzyme A synthetase/AMP-(fatty) acid ligase
MDRVGSKLNEMGIGRGDRVAFVIHQRPEMVGAFLTISVFASLVPMNPKFLATQLDFYLIDLKPKTLVV